MKVAILFSGGKDSVYAVENALQKKWDINYLLSIKPSRTDCYLFHFGGVEATPKIAKALGFRHIYAECDVADPFSEARIVKEIVEKHPVDALILGGVGLQVTQIKTLQQALPETKVFVSHLGLDHEKIIEEMLEKRYEIRIAQFAVEGLTQEWLGKKLDEETFKELKNRSKKYGFHIGGEGGHYDTIVTDGPIFKKRLEIEFEKVKETEYSGYIKIKATKLVKKETQRERWVE
ncbi:MAG: diphthine--ammonia ligase [Candidatus Pacearchaeota archaeon]|nr:diphthine--ammonia ligase [Candidatus Pacearchaeota archaeon]